MIIINLNNVYSQILYEQQDYKKLEKLLVKEMTVDIPGAKYLWSYKNGSWNGRANLWENNSDQNGIQIRTGLVPRFIRLLDENKISWRPGIDARNLSQIDEFKPTKVPLRDYQFEAVKAAFGNELENFGWWPRGVVEAPPGSGKTQIAIAMYEMNPVPTFFLVHRKDLLVQAYERFKKYNHKLGFIGDSKFDFKNNLNIATLQTLKKISDKPNDQRFQILNKLISNCQQIFSDESHLLAASLEKGNEFIQLVDKFDAPFRWGLTATPFRRTQYDNLLLEGTTGSSLYRISANELIKLGYLVKPKIVMKRVPGSLLASFDWKSFKSNKAKTEYWRMVEKKGIKFNEPRTNLIIDEILSGPYPLLLLVKTIEQANFIKLLYKSRCQQDLLFLSGKDKSSARKKAISQLKEGSLNTLMATTIFDEGIDIPELRKTIIGSGGKSDVKTIQRLGRLLRISEGKEEAIVVDFWDSHNPMLQRHSEARKKVYEDQGFNVVIERG